MSGASYEETKKRVEDRLDLLRDLYRRAVKMPHMSEKDLLVSKEAIASINHGERFLFRALEDLRHTDPVKSGDLMWAIDFLTSGVLLAASRTTLSESALNAAAHKRAQEMRAAKANPDKEEALTQAILTTLGGRDPAERGLSAKILGQVNRQMKAAGYEEVDRFVVGRRLKKCARLNSARSFARASRAHEDNQ